MTWSFVFIWTLCSAVLNDFHDTITRHLRPVISRGGFYVRIFSARVKSPHRGLTLSHKSLHVHKHTGMSLVFTVSGMWCLSFLCCVTSTVRFMMWGYLYFSKELSYEKPLNCFGIIYNYMMIYCSPLSHWQVTMCMCFKSGSSCKCSEVRKWEQYTDKSVFSSRSSDVTKKATEDRWWVKILTE